MEESTNSGRDHFKDLLDRRTRENRRFYARQPKMVKDVMASVMSRHGYGRVLSMERYQEALRNTIGKSLAQHVCVVGLRRGRIEIVVANSAVMQELAFLEADLLKGLATAVPDETIRDLRFRIGTVENG